MGREYDISYYIDGGMREMVAKCRFSFGQKALLLAAAGALCLCGLAAWGLANLNPIVIRMAEARASQLAVEAMNQAVDEVMGNSVTYSDLVLTSFDEQGRLSMLQANTMKMNDIASAAALVAQRNLGALAEQGVSIPLGAALGVSLFSGAGPMIKVSVVPVGSVTTAFATSFESAGINQTRHEISLQASVLMRIIVPTGADSVTVDTLVPIAESIIVGQVPSTYVNVPSDEDALNLVP